MAKTRDMTIGELKKSIAQFPDDMPVRVFLEEEVYANFSYSPDVFPVDGQIVHITPGKVID